MVIIQESFRSDIIDFIKHQINSDITEYIVDKFSDRNSITIDYSDISKNTITEISRLSKKFKNFKIVDNGASKISLISPKSKFWNNTDFNWALSF